MTDENGVYDTDTVEITVKAPQHTSIPTAYDVQPGGAVTVPLGETFAIALPSKTYVRSQICEEDPWNPGHQTCKPDYFSCRLYEASTNDFQIRLNAESGVISGTNGNIVKAGTGTLTLQGNNSYTGSTTISHASGKIKIERDAPLAYLGATSGFTGPGSLHVLPVSDDFSEAVSSADITLVSTWLNELVVGKAASSSTLYIDSHIRTNGIQTYNGPTIVRNGNWELETSNDVITFEDTLNSDGTPRNLTITNGSANLTLSGAVGGSNPLNNLTITTNVLTAGNITLNGTLSVTNSGSSTISGVIANGGSAASLIKSGSGLLTLSTTSGETS